MNLAAITHGDPAACRHLLHNARFEGLGAEAFGGAAVAELFRAQPIHWAAMTATLVHPRAAALFGSTDRGPAALFADLHDGHVARLWLIADHDADNDAGCQPAIATHVPVDTDRDQRGPAFPFDPAEHPTLDPAHAGRIATLGAALIDGGMPWPSAPQRHARVRPLVLRAISAGGATGLLLRVQSLADARAGGIRSAYGAALLDARETLIPDAAALRMAARTPWNPRI